MRGEGNLLLLLFFNFNLVTDHTRSSEYNTLVERPSGIAGAHCSAQSALNFSASRAAVVCM